MIQHRYLPSPELSPTSLHYLAECPAYSLVRWEVFNTDRMKEEDLGDVSIVDILRFSRITGRFEGETLARHQ